MPAGSTMWCCASSEKPVGRACRTALPGRRLWRSRHRARGARRQHRPRRVRATCASKCCEPRRPPVRLTMTDWISTFAIRSAAWTAWRIAVFRRLEIDDRAAFQAERALVADADDAREMGAPAQRFERLDRLQLGDEADDLARADVEHGQRRALARRQRLQPRRQALMRETHVSTPLPRIGFFFSVSDAGGRGLFGEAHDDPVRHAQIDRRARPCRESSARVRASGGGRAPRAAPSSGRRTSMPLSILSVQRRPETSVPARMRLFSGPAASSRARYSCVRAVRFLADDERQVGEALVLHLVDHGSVGGDDEELAVALPQRMGSRSMSVTTSSSG